MKAPGRGFTLAAGLAIVGATCIPLIINFLGTPAGASFVWAVGFLPDTIGNLMFSRQGADGRLLFADLYTSEPHPASLFNPLFLALGWFQSVTGLFPPLALQALRLVAGAFLVAGIHRLCLRFFNGTPERRFAFLTVLLTGGLGFLAVASPLFRASADIRGPEITTFFSLYHQAHFAAALAIIAFMSVLFISAVERDSIPRAVGAGALYLALVSIHPYDAPMPVAAGALWIVLRKNICGITPSWKPFLAFAAIPLPILIHDWSVVTSVPVFREFYQHGLVAKPWSLGAYALGWGFALPFAFIGAVRAVKTRESAWLFPLAWVAVTPLLMMLPTPSSRRVLEGTHIFLCLLAARGVLSLAPFASPLRRTALYSGLAIASLSSVYVMARDVYSAFIARHPTRQMATQHEGLLTTITTGPADRFFTGTNWNRSLIINEADRYYIPRDLLSVLENIPLEKESGAVLSVHETGLLIPVLSGRAVFVGHFGETLRFREKNAALHAFMNLDMSDEARRFFLAESGITLVVWEPRMARLGGWRPEGRKWLKKVFQAGSYALYRAERQPVSPGYTLENLRSETNYHAFMAEGKISLDDGNWGDAVEAFARMLAIRNDDPEALRLMKRASVLSENRSIR